MLLFFCTNWLLSVVHYCVIEVYCSFGIMKCMLLWLKYRMLKRILLVFGETMHWFTTYYNNSLCWFLYGPFCHGALKFNMLLSLLCRSDYVFIAHIQNWKKILYCRSSCYICMTRDYVSNSISVCARDHFVVVT